MAYIVHYDYIHNTEQENSARIQGREHLPAVYHFSLHLLWTIPKTHYIFAISQITITWEFTK